VIEEAGSSMFFDPTIMGESGVGLSFEGKVEGQE
jgi:hypothetical protein